MTSRPARPTRRRSRAPELLLAGLALGACRGPATVLVVDLDARPIPGAVLVDLDGTRWEADGGGRLHLRGPTAGVVEADGFLPEPALVVPGTDPFVALIDRAEGRRAVHLGGDFMLGRRFAESWLDPDDLSGSASAVVAHLGPMFAAADLSTLNLESTVGDLDPADAYPGKRYLIQTRGETLDALAVLGVDAALTANNHVRDWLDPGVASTQAWCDSLGMPCPGSGLSTDEAEPEHRFEGAPSIVSLAFTTINGDTANDRLPRAGDPLSGLEPDWAIAPRTWGDAARGVPVASRLPGDAWALFQGAEPGWTPEDAASAWASLSSVYPELQDLAARRGHGGARGWSEGGADAVRAAGADEDAVVVVQVHGGIQYAQAPSAGMRDIARSAIDAGADLVVMHHPHVWQGVEWYGERPIAYSIGNLVFDQDLGMTQRTGFLRVVFEPDGALVDVRLVPLYLDGYRPEPALGSVGARIFADVAERSFRARVATSTLDTFVGPGFHVEVDPRDPDDGGRAAVLRVEYGTARLENRDPTWEDVRLVPDAEGLAAVPPGLVDPRSLPRGAQIGRERLLFGDFEGGPIDAPWGWSWTSSDVSLRDDDRALQLVRDPRNVDVAFARTRSRVDVEAQRWRRPDGAPVDDAARYELSARVWRDGEPGRATARLDLEALLEDDPILGTVRDPLGEVEIVLDCPQARAWCQTRTPFDALGATAIMVNLRLAPPTAHTTVVRLDDVRLIEWRDADLEPDGPVRADFVVLPDGAAVIRHTSW